MQALLARMQTALAPAQVDRNVDEVLEASSVGLARLRDGETTMELATIGVRTWDILAGVSLCLAIQLPDANARSLALDGLVKAAVDAIDLDPTLGGAVDWTEARGISPVEEAITGAAGLASVTVDLVLQYTSSSQVG
jgi:hypothetical protein